MIFGTVRVSHRLSVILLIGMVVSLVATIVTGFLDCAYNGVLLLIFLFLLLIWTRVDSIGGKNG